MTIQTSTQPKSSTDPLSTADALTAYTTSGQIAQPENPDWCIGCSPDNCCGCGRAFAMQDTAE